MHSATVHGVYSVTVRGVEALVYSARTGRSIGCSAKSEWRQSVTVRGVETLDPSAKSERATPNEYRSHGSQIQTLLRRIENSEASVHVRA